MKRFIHVTNAREVGFTFVNLSSQVVLREASFLVPFLGMRGLFILAGYQVIGSNEFFKRRMEDFMMEYKDTLLMPKTEFPMQGNLPKREPEIQEKWKEMNIYKKVQEQTEGRPFIHFA